MRRPVGIEREMTEKGAIEYAQLGQGPAVVLLHGTPGSWRQLMTLAEDLSCDFTAVLPSRPGYGATPLPSGRSCEEQAEVYASLLDRLGIERAAVIGVSGGGPSALAFALTGRVSALVLGCAVAPHLLRVPRMVRAAVVLGPVAGVVGAVSHAVRRRRARRIGADRLVRAGLTADDRARLDEPGVREALERYVRSHAEAPPGVDGMRNDVRCFLGVGEAPDLSRLELPVLVQHGDADDTTPLDHGRFFAESITGAELDVYEGAGHLYLLTRRREATDRIRCFLSDQPAGP